MKSKSFLFVILLLIVFGPFLIRSHFLLYILIMTLLYGGAASAWNIVGGFAGYLPLCYSTFFGIGAYTSTLLYVHYDISPWIGMVVGIGLVIPVAIFIGIPTFRLKGPFFALGTLAFGEVARLIAINWRKVTMGSLGISVPFKPSFKNLMFQETVYYVYTALVFVLLVIWICWMIKKSRLGYYLVALREDEEGAMALGVNNIRYKLIAWAISAGLTAIGGVIYANFVLFIEPYTIFSLDFSIQLPVIVIIGGMGKLFGPILGSFLLVPLGEVLRSWLGGEYKSLHLIIYGLVLILVVMLIPQGIIELIRSKLRFVTDRLGGRK